MTDKEFRRLSRADLIEIIYELQKNERVLREENELLRKQLEDRRIIIEKSGSMAEVLATLNGLFEAAQITADDYKNNAQALMEEAKSIKEEADAYFARVEEKAKRLVSITINQRDKMLENAKEEARRILESSCRKPYF